MNRSEHGDEEKTPNPYRDSNHQSSKPVAQGYTAELSKLLYTMH
jgi:hypothetical protein